MPSPGSIAYLQIPAADPAASAEFYRAVFGWSTRSTRHGAAFDDGSGQVSGTWVTDRPPGVGAGPLVYVRVADVELCLRAAQAAGGAVVTERYAQNAGEFVATLSDPAGNELGVFQE